GRAGRPVPERDGRGGGGGPSAHPGPAAEGGGGAERGPAPGHGGDLLGAGVHGLSGRHYREPPPENGRGPQHHGEDPRGPVHLAGTAGPPRCAGAPRPPVRRRPYTILSLPSRASAGARSPSTRSAPSASS